VGRGRTSGRARRRDPGRSDLSPPVVELRALTDTAGDVALGQMLVREYVVATAAEQSGTSDREAVERILPYIPDWDDFAGRFLRAGGAFVVAHVDGDLSGCVGVTRLEPTVCEMNRLWVRSPYRSAGVGRALAVASMDEARRLGFTRMLLDVLPQRTGAIALYRSLGFVEVPPIHEYAFEMVFLGRDL
jgi:ribosomal protein S18 acetylase RimI-like enzyme